MRRADELPTIGIGGTVQRQPAGSKVVTSYAVGVTTNSYELDLFGRVHALSDAALAQYFATAEARKAVQISLVSSIANTYLPLLADDEQLSVTRQTLDTREESTRLTKLRFDNGASSELDYRQAESLLEGARVALAQSIRVRALDENALVLLVGQPLPDDLPAGLPLDQQQIPIELPAGLPSELLARRPDIRASEQQLRAANANIGAARAAFYPSISLTAAFGTASIDLSNLFKSGTWAFTGTAQLLQPIFDAGRNQANLDFAYANRDVAVAQYERSIQSVPRSPTRRRQRHALSRCARKRRRPTRWRSAIARRSALPFRCRELSRCARCPALAVHPQLAGADAGGPAAELVLFPHKRPLGGGWHESAEVQAVSNPRSCRRTGAAPEARVAWSAMRYRLVGHGRRRDGDSGR